MPAAFRHLVLEVQSRVERTRRFGYYVNHHMTANNSVKAEESSRANSARSSFIHDGKYGLSIVSLHLETEPASH
jgi:hypothetical protein